MSLNRVLITGAAGALGRALRERFQGTYPVLRLSDRDSMAEAGPGEEVMQAELADFDAVSTICEDVDAIVHLGGQPIEADWSTVLNANIIGCYNLYEAARQQGVKRVVFASSNHAIGFHRRTERIDHLCQHRPDGRYGLSKAFGEDLARLYAYKWGVTSMCIRIGSCREEPIDARQLSMFQSFDDLAQLAKIGLEADLVFEVVYGVSDNPASWWNNANAYRLGYRPKDTAETHNDKVGHLVTDDPVTEAFMGGAFCADEFTGDIEKIP